ncbi:MAG TPA: hypothetical protein VFE47_04355 [Tepidisphaeraceae bacterium]|jgi:hypothetical protein|nr:hypothetical protein [Tepidisphaeraceae bacterium]
MKIEFVVFCEGFHDRAFWKGWLSHLGCTDPGAQLPTASTRREVSDPWGGKVTRGRFAFNSPTGHFIQVCPCGGKANIMPLVRQRLKKHTTEPARRIIINEDSDLAVGAPADLATPATVETVVRQFDASATQSATGEWQMYGGSLGISLVLWNAGDPPTAGVPDFQTLERLVSAAICSAKGGRGTAIRDWLNSRPNPPPADPKEFAWSHMAGWYASSGGEAFYSNLWNDAAIATELQNRLRANGAWDIVADFAK